VGFGSRGRQDDGRRGAKPAFKNYKPASADTPYPYVLCTSVNHEIVHGMPSKGRKVRAGDIVSLDTGLSMNGYSAIRPLPWAWVRLVSQLSG